MKILRDKELPSETIRLKDWNPGTTPYVIGTNTQNQGVFILVKDGFSTYRWMYWGNSMPRMSATFNEQFSSAKDAIDYFLREHFSAEIHVFADMCDFKYHFKEKWGYK